MANRQYGDLHLWLDSRSFSAFDELLGRVTSIEGLPVYQPNYVRGLVGRIESPELIINGQVEFRRR